MQIVNFMEIKFILIKRKIFQNLKLKCDQKLLTVKPNHLCHLRNRIFSRFQHEFGYFNVRY